MGGGQSVQFDPCSMTAEQIATYLVAKNQTFEKYRASIVENDINAKVLLQIRPEDLDDFLKEINMESVLLRASVKVAHSELLALTISSTSATVNAYDSHLDTEKV